MTPNPNTHTPEEAMKLWCPQTKRNTFQGVSPWAAACIGPRCAAWQWEPDLAAPGHITYSPTHGFCGLMGIRP